MKKTIKVSIGAIPFNLDEDAYQLLDGYIKNLKKHFTSLGEGEEIISDIEMRLSELLQMRLKGVDSVVSLNDAQEIIAIMGNPKDFDGELDGDATKANPASQIYDEAKPKAKKKLYRDMDQRILGGVFSGLGHYFRVDPVALRIVYVLLGFVAMTTWGQSLAGFIVSYIVFWIAMPKASTFRQKLAMTGTEPSIYDIEDRATTKQPYRGSMLVSGIVLLFKIFLGFIGLVTLITFLAILLCFVVLAFDNEVYIASNFLTLVGLNTSYFKLAFFLLISLPTLAVLMLVGKALFSSSYKRLDMVLLSLMLVLWITSIGYISWKGVKMGNKSSNYREREQVDIKTDAKALHIKLADSYLLDAKRQPNLSQMLYKDVNGQRMVSLVPELSLRQDSVADIQLHIVKRAHGSSSADARIAAADMKLDYTITDSVLVVNPVWYSNDKSWGFDRYSLEIVYPYDKKVEHDSSFWKLTYGYIMHK